MICLDSALRLLVDGFWPVPLQPFVGDGDAQDGKKPLRSKWGEIPPTEQSLRAVFKYHPTAGLALRVGPEGGLIDFDLDDPEIGGISIAEIFGPQGPPLTWSWSTRRGRHWLFRWTDSLLPLSIHKTTWRDFGGLELRIGGPGKAVAATIPPTLFALDSPRCWDDPDASLAELPRSALDSILYRCKVPKPRPATPPPVDSGEWAMREKRAVAWLSRRDPAVSGCNGRNKFWLTACELMGFAVSRQELRFLLELYNRTCQPPFDDRELNKTVDRVVELSHKPFGHKLDDPSRERPTCGRRSRPQTRNLGPRVHSIEEMDDVDLREDFQVGPNGYPYPNLPNSELCLRILEEPLWYDAFGGISYRGKTPIQDQDINLLTSQIQREFLPTVATGTVATAIENVCRLTTKNGPRDYLDQLPAWDGIDRIEHFWIDCYGVEDSEYSRAVGRNFWVGLVGRILDPGCKLDNMVVLEGLQGIKKSSSLSVIGGEWFAECNQNLDSSDFYLSIAGKWLVEFSEMHNLIRTDESKVKQILSQRVDEFRRAYGRKFERRPRTCVFVGTTNRDDWHKDDTGGRRYWPLRVNAVEIDKIRSNRDQLFAEAVSRFRSGETYWEVPADLATSEQMDRIVTDPWETAVLDYSRFRVYVTSTEVLKDAVGLPLHQQTVKEDRRIGSILRKSGWISDRKRVGNERVRIWLNPDSTVQNPQNQPKLDF